jgi:hypothetical protein
MNDHAPASRDQLAAAYLQQMQALGREISISMDAIGANALPTLQESIAKQEMLCASLACMANEVSEGFRTSEPPSFSGIDSAVERKIGAARKALLDLNLKYAALLKHSGRTIALLSTLCKSHTGQFQEARGPRLKHQTWSCEM